MKRWSSLRTTRAPMPFSAMAPLLRRLGRRGAAACGGHDGLDDVVVAGAAAEVALEVLAHLLLGRVRDALQHVDRGHDHAGGAEAALEPVVLAEGLLHRVQATTLGQALDRRHRRAF